MDPPGRDHHRQPGHQLAQHLPGDAPAAEDDPRPQHRRGHPRSQDALHLPAAGQVGGQGVVLVPQPAQVDHLAQAASRGSGRGSRRRRSRRGRRPACQGRRCRRRRPCPGPGTSRGGGSWPAPRGRRRPGRHRGRSRRSRWPPRTFTLPPYAWPAAVRRATGAAARNDVAAGVANGHHGRVESVAAPPATPRGPGVVLRAAVAADVVPLWEAVCESVDQLRPWMAWCHDGYSREEAAGWVETAQEGRRRRELFDFLYHRCRRRPRRRRLWPEPGRLDEPAGQPRVTGWRRR